MVHFNYSKLLILGALGSFCTTTTAQKSTRPNILIILADDLGHGDLSYTGGKTPTPNIDRILSEGVRFNNFMTYTVSSPTRAGLLTGLHPLRTGQGPETDGNLDPNITTIGSYFQKEGYRTGIFGKWHNSPSPRKDPGAISVNKYGFDRFVGFYAGGIDYYSKGSSGWFHDNQLIEDELDYSTDLISKYAIEFMKNSKDSNRPFLCYVPFNAVHTPLNVKEDILKRVPDQIRSKVSKFRSIDEYRKIADYPTPPLRAYNAEKYNDDSWNMKLDDFSKEEVDLLYSAILISLDDNIGKIMDYLRNSDQLNNTIVLFFCDNGGTPQAGNNFPFRGFKHTLFEGGIHSAAAALIPKSVLPDVVKEVPAMVGYLDVFPTLAALTKSRQPLPELIDGVSFMDNLKGIPKQQSDRYYYWSWSNYDVVRSYQWKLFRYFGHVELYDMVNDIGETKNVATSNPEIVKKLSEQIEIEAQKLGMANAHVPLQVTVNKPNPAGNAIAFEINEELSSNLKKQTIQVLNKPTSPLPDYYLEYDIKVKSDASLSYCYFSPGKNNSPLFGPNNGVDQTGHLLQSPIANDSDWRHVAVGIGNFSPHKFGQYFINYKFDHPGKATIYLDNIVVRNMKGEIVQQIFVDEFNKNGFKSSDMSVRIPD